MVVAIDQDSVHIGIICAKNYPTIYGYFILNFELLTNPRACFIVSRFGYRFESVLHPSDKVFTTRLGSILPIALLFIDELETIFSQPGQTVKQTCINILLQITVQI